MDAFCSNFALWLIDFYALATILLAASLAARMLLRQPASRVVLAWGTWMSVVVLALLVSLRAWPKYEVAKLLVGPGLEFASGPRPPLAAGESAESDLIAPSNVTAAQALARAESDSMQVDFARLASGGTPAGGQPAREWLAYIWMAGSALMAVWMLLGAVQASRLLRSAAEAPPWARQELACLVGLKHNLPGLWSSPRVSTAVALRALRPQIVLPCQSLERSNAPAVRAALAHEWAHIRHGDLWLLVLERLVVVALFPHPLLWWLRRRIRLDLELAADAAAAGDRPLEYAEALLAWAKTAGSRPPGLAALCFWERPGTLSRRLKMVLDPYRSPPRPHSRWRWLLIAGIPVALVPGLALCTLHPLTAQEESAPRMRYAEVPAGAERKGSSAAKVSRVPATQIQLDLLVMSVDRKKLAAADITLEDTIAEATESRCRREAGLVVADVQPGEVQKIVEALKRHEAVKVVSEPSIITLDGREAHFHVGGELPLLRIEETVNGRYERRIEHQAFGTMLTVRPKLKNLNGQRVALDLLAEQASLLPPGKAAGEGDVARELPGLVSHKFKLASDVALGGSLLVAESPAEKERRDHDAQFLLVISPKRAIRKDIVVYANPVQGEKATAPYAASAAEPEPGTAAEALLKAERDARQKETAELMRQIEMLKEQLARFQVKPAADPAAEAIPEARLERANRDLYSADVAEARLNLERAENEFARVEQMKDKGLISDTAFEDKQYALELAKIQLRRAESNLFAPPARLPAAADSAAGRPPVDPQTEIRLLELDLAEARLELEVNEAELAQAEEIKQKASAAISEQELRTLRLKVQRAKIQLERVGVQLAAAQRRLQQSR